MRCVRVLFVWLAFVAVPAVAATPPGPNDVYVRVVDVGPGLCCVIKLPGPKYVIYDAGLPAGEGVTAFAGIQKVIPADSDIELMVVSHSDGDHLGAVEKICDAYHVKRVLRSGFRRDRRGHGAADQRQPVEL